MRPLNANELKQKHLHARVWKVLPQYSSITQTTRGDVPVGHGETPIPRIAGRTYFSFDKTFDHDVTTNHVYQATACRDIVASVVLTGRHGTIFAYGQTSSGKTYTMQGPPAAPEQLSTMSLSSSSSSSSSPPRQSPASNSNNNSNSTICHSSNSAPATTTSTTTTSNNTGIVQLAARDIFDHIQNTPQRQFQVVASYLEIYNEEVRDLLVGGGGGSSAAASCDCNKKAAATAAANAVLQIREDPHRGVFVQDAREQIVTTYAELLAVLARGEGCRKVAATDMNERSSRSHTIFRITVTSSSPTVCRKKRNDENNHDHDDDDSDYDSSSNIKNEDDGNDDHDHDACSNGEIDANGPVLTATLNLVDLAGSESVRHTGVTGDRQKEGGMINQSLLTLSRVITALGTPNVWHVNFRDSKLTRLLQPSLSGNARMAIICCATPSELYLEETRSTLAFASRAKLVKTHAEVNEILEEGNHAALIAKLKRDLARAERLLSERDIHGPHSELVKELEMKVQEAQALAKESQDRLHRLQASVLNGGILLGRDHLRSPHHQHHYEDDTISSSGHATTTATSPVHMRDTSSTSPQRPVAALHTLSGSSFGSSSNVGQSTLARDGGDDDEDHHHSKEDTGCSSSARSLVVTPVKRIENNSAATISSSPSTPKSSPRKRELTTLRETVCTFFTRLDVLRIRLEEISSRVQAKESELLAASAERDGAKQESSVLAMELESLRAELQRASLEHRAMLQEKDNAVQDVLNCLERELDKRRQLEDAFNAVKDEKAQWESQRADFWSKIQALEDERNEASAWAENLELEAIQTHESCAAQLGEAQQAFEELQQQLETTKGELATVQRDRDAKRALLDKKRQAENGNINKLQQEQKQQQEAIDSLRAVLKAKQTELLSTKRERDVLRRDLKETKQQLTDERAAKGSSQAELLSVKAERNVLGSDLKDAKHALNEQVAKMDALHDELLAIKTERDVISSDLKVTTSSLTEERAANNAVQSELLSIKTERDALRCELQKTSNLLTEERAAKAAIHTEVLSIKTERDALSCMLKETAQSLTHKQAANETSHAEVLSVKMERDAALSCELEHATKSLAEERAAKEASVAELLSVQTERDALYCTLQETTQSLAAKTIEAAKAQETIDSLQSTLDSTRGNEAKVKKTINSLQSALDASQAELVTVTAERDHLTGKLEVMTQYLEDERVAVNQLNKTIANLMAIEEAAPAVNDAESSSSSSSEAQSTAVVLANEPPTIPLCYRSMYPLPSTITVSQLDLIGNTTTRFLLYGPMAFALEGAGKDELMAFIELFKRCFKMPEHVPLQCPRGCGRTFVSLPLLLSHMECRNAPEHGGQCPDEPTLQSTQITPAFVVSVRILPFLKSLWSAIHRKQIAGPLDILDPLAIPLPIGEAAWLQYRDDSIAQELALELETLDRSHHHHHQHGIGSNSVDRDKNSNSSSSSSSSSNSHSSHSNKPDMIEWWKQKLKYVKEHRDVDTTKAYPHILTMSFLQPPWLWPDDLKRLVEFDG
jgi:centromeric protein E